MKICITASGNTTDSAMDPRFGRAPYFIFVDTDSGEIEAIANSAAASGGGAGVASGQLMADKGIDIVITGNLGPNATNVLQASNIKAYRGEMKSIKENIENYKQGRLEEIDVSVSPHSGLGDGGGLGGRGTGRGGGGGFRKL